MSSRFKFQIPDSLKYESGDNKSDDMFPPLSSSASLEQQLRFLIGTHCPTNVAKYQLLKRRDDLLCKLRVRNTDVNAAKVLSGDCPDMCPEKERYMRDTQKNLSKYERDQNGVMIPHRTVKDYSRSAADQEEPLPHELRPINVLQMTMHYLIVKIANDIPSISAELAKWYDFLWSRMRSIRKDITQQMLTDCAAADLVEKCARFHIFASFHLASLEESDFSQKMNTENLSKSFQTLRHMYDDTARDGRFCPNEAEFRSYDMILNLTDFNVHSEVLSYRSEIYTSPPVQLALELASTFQSNNYVKFFRLLKERASFLQTCLCYRYFPALRLSALKVMAQSYRMLPLDFVARTLGYDDAASAQSFLNALDVEIDMSDASVVLIHSRARILQSQLSDLLVSTETCQWVYEKMSNHALPAILCNETVVSQEVIIPPPINSFDEFSCYTYDPILAKILGEVVKPTNHLNDAKLKAENERQIQSSKPSDVTFNKLLWSRQTTKLESRIAGIHNSGRDALTNLLPASLMSATSFTANNEEAHFKISSAQTHILKDCGGKTDEMATSLHVAPYWTKQKQQQQQPQHQRVSGLCDGNDDPSGSRFDQLENHMSELQRNRKEREKEEGSKRRVFLQKFYFCKWFKFVLQRRQRHIDALREMAKNFVAKYVNNLLNVVVASEVAAIAERAILFERIGCIRNNLRNLWLRQFTDHWMKVIVQKRRLREIQLNGGNSALCPRVYFSDHRQLEESVMKRVSADKVELRLHLVEFSNARKSYLQKKYFEKWIDFVSYRRKKRYVDSFFTSTKAKSFGGNLYKIALKRKAKSVTTLFSEMNSNCGLLMSSGSDTDRDNLFSTPIFKSYGVPQGKRRRLLNYFKSYQFSPI